MKEHVKCNLKMTEWIFFPQKLECVSLRPVRVVPRLNWWLVLRAFRSIVWELLLLEGLVFICVQESKLDRIEPGNSSSNVTIDSFYKTPFFSLPHLHLPPSQCMGKTTPLSYGSVKRGWAFLNIFNLKKMIINGAGEMTWWWRAVNAHERTWVHIPAPSWWLTTN